MNLQGKANGRKVVVLAKCGICKERKIQGKINLNLQGKEMARKGIWREMESVRNGICKELNLQVKVTFNVNIC